MFEISTMSTPEPLSFMFTKLLCIGTVQTLIYVHALGSNRRSSKIIAGMIITALPAIAFPMFVSLHP